MPEKDSFKQSVNNEIRGKEHISFNESNLHKPYLKNTTAAWANQEERTENSRVFMPDEFEAYMAREWVNENQK